MSSGEMAGELEIQRTSNFERHVQTALALLIVMLMGWVGITISNSSNQIARLEERVAAMTAKLDELNGMRVMVGSLEVRVGQLERQMEARRNER